MIQLHNSFSLLFSLFMRKWNLTISLAKKKRPKYHLVGFNSIHHYLHSYVSLISRGTIIFIEILKITENYSHFTHCEILFSFILYLVCGRSGRIHSQSFHTHHLLCCPRSLKLIFSSHLKSTIPFYFKKLIGEKCTKIELLKSNKIFIREKNLKPKNLTFKCVKKVPGSFCCYSNHAPKVIQPSFDAQSLCRLHTLLEHAACQLQAVEQVFFTNDVIVMGCALKKAAKERIHSRPKGGSLKNEIIANKRVKRLPNQRVLKNPEISCVKVNVKMCLIKFHIILDKQLLIQTVRTQLLKTILLSFSFSFPFPSFSFLRTLGPQLRPPFHQHWALYANGSVKPLTANIEEKKLVESLKQSSLKDFCRVFSPNDFPFTDQSCSALCHIRICLICVSDRILSQYHFFFQYSPVFSCHNCQEPSRYQELHLEISIKLTWINQDNSSTFVLFSYIASYFIPSCSSLCLTSNLLHSFLLFFSYITDLFTSKTHQVTPSSLLVVNSYIILQILWYAFFSSLSHALFFSFHIDVQKLPSLVWSMFLSNLLGFWGLLGIYWVKFRRNGSIVSSVGDIGDSRCILGVDWGIVVWLVVFGCVLCVFSDELKCITQQQKDKGNDKRKPRQRHDTTRQQDSDWRRESAEDQRRRKREERNTLIRQVHRMRKACESEGFQVGSARAHGQGLNLTPGRTSGPGLHGANGLRLVTSLLTLKPKTVKILRLARAPLAQASDCDTAGLGTSQGNYLQQALLQNCGKPQTCQDPQPGATLIYLAVVERKSNSEDTVNVLPFAHNERFKDEGRDIIDLKVTNRAMAIGKVYDAKVEYKLKDRGESERRLKHRRMKVCEHT
ncbi:putative signal peptide protein [Puccinia sorghi]|uniref:Putative signal peptide protein n=1 Tax=Puccinia sorghi TaxID=27349 RepID=A0A0L6UVU5_9BASI|nr:putative signal peptide protein [Puccinia sorghi]